MLVFIAACLIGIGISWALVGINSRLSYLEDALDKMNGGYEVDVNVRLTNEDVKKVVDLCADEVERRKWAKFTTQDVKKLIDIADKMAIEMAEKPKSEWPTEEEYYEKIYNEFKNLED